MIGISLDLGIRKTVQDRLFRQDQRTATNWMASMRPGDVPRPTAMSKVDLLQLVDSRNRVVLASPAAAGRPALTSPLPPPEDRLEYRTVCEPDGTCLMLTAMRSLPYQANLIWGGEPHAVYSGRAEPAILATRRLELFTAVGVLLATALLAWGRWCQMGRALRPVEEIRATMSEITASDLSLRVPQPPGHDVFAELARTANQTLDRLESAVGQLRLFASVASHELKTPLTGLRAALEEALLYRDEVDAHKTIEVALETTDRCKEIIDDLLALTRVRAADPVQPEPVDLGLLVEQETGQTRGVPVHAKTVKGLTVLGHRIQLVRVLTNLLANAQRHAHSAVWVTAERDGDQAVVAVQDDGDGIPPEDRERIFEPFVRLRDAQRRDPKGTGLGLAISRSVLEAHDGTLQVEDSSHGARFVVRLPLADGLTPDNPRGDGPRNQARPD
ncbi:HAMP domain-containing sensor histidine kinase [Planotetraspora mira]|nr:HAMP domain-containing sensor histidine kinase [Planotetraspora mira]